MQRTVILCDSCGNTLDQNGTATIDSGKVHESLDLCETCAGSLVVSLTARAREVGARPKRRGRPPKTTAATAVPKRPRGRPRKEQVAA